MATGVDNSGLYAGRREAMGIIKAMASEITSFDVFSGIGISAATAFASAAKSSYDFEKEFRKNMLEVATISTQVEGSMTDFMNQVMEITQQVPIKAPEAAKALYQIVSAGHDGAAGMNVLEVAAKSAVGGITDTVTAADAITTLLNAYKLSADDAEKVSDQLFTTARLGKTTFGELGQSIAQVAPIAAAYGVEMDQVLAAVATLTKSGTPTAQAMTQIRASIIGTSKVLGDGAFDSMTFQEALAEIANRAGGSEAKLRELIPEVEAVNGVLGLTGIKAQDAAEHLNAMNESAGATEAAFKLMMNDVDKQMTLLSNNIQAALRPMGQAILKEVSEVATAFNEAFENGDAKEAMKTLGDLIVIVTGAFIGYKGAVISSTVIQNVYTKAMVVSRLASIQHITTTQLLTNAIKAQTVAMLKNIAVLATNPYILAAAAISFLGYQVYKYATQATAAEKAQKRFNDRLDDQKNKSEEYKAKIEELINTIKSETDTEYERNKALKALKDLYPDIFKIYDIETLKLTDILSLKKQIAEIEEQKAYQSDKDHFGSLVGKRDELDKELSYRSANYGNGQYKYAKFQDKTVNELRKERESLAHEIDLMRSGLMDKAAEIWDQSTPKEVKIISLEKNVESLKKEQEELNTLINREKDGSNPIARIASPVDIARLEVVNGLIKEQSEELNSLRKISNPGGMVAGSSISKEINIATQKVSTLKQELADLRSGKTSAEAGKTVKETIDAKLTELKAAEDALSTLTGKDKGSIKDAADRLKTKQEQADLLLEISRNAKERGNAERQTAFEIEQVKIDVMKDGFLKEQAQIELNHSKSLQGITQRGEEMLKAQQEAERKQWEKDGKKGVFTPKTTSVSQLPTDQLQQLSGLMNGVVAKTNHDNQTLIDGMVKQYQTYAEKRKEIEKKFDDDIRSMQEKNENGKYDANIKEADKQKITVLAELDMEANKTTSAINKLFGDMRDKTLKDLDAINKAGEEALNFLKNDQWDATTGARLGISEETFETWSKSPDKLKDISDALIDNKNTADSLRPAFDKVSGGLTKVFSAGDDNKKLKEGLAEIEEGMNDVMQAGQFLADSFSAIGDAFGSDLMSGVADGLNVAMDAMSSAMEGAKAGAMFGPIGAAAGAAIGVVTSLATSIAKIHDAKNEKRIERLQDQIETLDRSYEMLGESIEKAYSKDASQLIEQQNILLEQQKALINQQIAEEQDKKKTDNGKIKDWQNQLEDIDRTLADNKEKAVDAIFGEDLQSAIDNFAQAYVDAWASGEDRAKSMKDVARNMIRSTIVEMIKSSAGLGETVKKIRSMIEGYLTDGVINDWEQGQLDAYIESETARLDAEYGWADKYMKKDKEFDLGISSDSIADTIAEGLADGKSGFKDFAGSFEDMMRTAVINSLKTKHLEGPLKEFQKKFSELSESGGQLTEAEIEELRGMYADIIDGAKVQFDSLKDIAGLDFTADSDNSLKGAYAKASQESITLLAGQTGAQRVIMEDIRNNMIPIREQMLAIREMNSKGWEDVKAIKELTTKIDKNTERVAENTRQIKEVADKVADNTRNTVDALEGTINVKIKGM